MTGILNRNNIRPIVASDEEVEEAAMTYLESFMPAHSKDRLRTIVADYAEDLGLELCDDWRPKAIHRTFDIVKTHVTTGILLESLINWGPDRRTPYRHEDKAIVLILIRTIINAR